MEHNCNQVCDFKFYTLIYEFSEMQTVMVDTWMVWPKRRTAPFFEGEIKLAREETLASGRMRLLLGSWKSMEQTTFSLT